MKLSSGLKKFLVAFGLIFVLGIAGATTTPKSAVQGIKTNAPTVVPKLEKQSVTQPKTATPKPIKKPTIMPTLAPTKAYIAPTATPTPVPAKTTSSGLSNDNSYINSAGNQVHSPAYSNSVPAGATAVCGDGTYSFSQSRRGTCSHHGGVSQWL